jgi:hypothetical protein
MQITHEEARKLIQLALDGPLHIDQRNALDSHIAICAACQQYADSITNMESVLRPLLQRQWNQQPIPLSVGMIVSANHSRSSNQMLLATRVAALSVMFIVFVFSAWQFSLSKPSAKSSVTQANIPLIPIPSTSAQLVTTSTHDPLCDEIIYVVKENDTLSSIATQFAVSKEELSKANDIETEVVRSGARLMIPICQPTRTVDTLTRTFTPVLNTITATPGG